MTPGPGRGRGRGRGLAEHRPIALLALIPLDVIAESASVAIGLAAALLAIELLGWRVVAAMLDREHRTTGARTESPIRVETL